jgi:hypothetical protein
LFSRDYLIRQLQQFMQALSLVLFHRREGEHDLAQSIIHNTLMDVLGRSLDDLRQMSREELTGLMSPGGSFDTETAVALADLLREDEEPDGRARARWLYEAALKAGGTVPHDIHDRIEALPVATPRV